ncbi:MAG: hypothetical protein EOO07_02545 [Chitinophagaceae bacterium]|nr:MAG: hypothetical protein EOO07_02545 [Chitinophagaceae bacterium]
MKKSKYIGLVALFAMALFLGACSKTEFIPDPEGEKIPFQPNATQTVEELLPASPAKLFYSAWQKSTIKNILQERGSKVVYTVLAPSDAAMQLAGVTAATIAQMSAQQADELVLFFVTLRIVAPDELKLREDNFMVNSLLQRPGLFVRFYESNNPSQANDPYFFRHYLAVKDDQLLVNGKSTGKLNYQPATNGGIYFLEKIVEKPTKTILEALEADGRFNLFLAALKATDDYYIDKVASDIEPLFGYKPDAQEIMYSYAYLRNYYTKDFTINENNPGYPNITLTTIFAPTDEAFHKAGFQTIADIEAFNLSRSSVIFSENTYSAEGGLPMDTIFSYHRDFGRIFQPATSGGDKTVANSTVFYSNVLKPVLNEYLVSAGGNPSIEFAFKMPLAFTNTSNGIQLKVKETDYRTATVIEGDINTLNGPIHVVNELLVPKGFKLN